MDSVIARNTNLSSNEREYSPGLSHYQNNLTSVKIEKQFNTEDDDSIIIEDITPDESDDEFSSSDSDNAEIKPSASSLPAPADRVPETQVNCLHLTKNAANKIMGNVRTPNVLTQDDVDKLRNFISDPKLYFSLLSFVCVIGLTVACVFVVKSSTNNGNKEMNGPSGFLFMGAAIAGVCMCVISCTLFGKAIKQCINS